ncbi:MAG: thiamine-phosphate kinase [Phycisphaeraceae bacterium]|nr:thiamine-phosphate kinase [Phycisphaeraceae bacterium]
MRESELLAKIAERSASLTRAFPHVAVGPGDDCAVVRIGNTDCLLTVDQVIEGSHFRKATPLDLIARKAIARSISDIAAMAGTPVCALATGALPKGFEQSKADELFDCMKRWAEHWACPLVGGDIASLPQTSDPMTLTVTVIGSTHPARGPVLRSGAQAGDGIYVTGKLGGSFDAASGLGKHLTFEPRLAEARWLADTLGARLHSMMDISDGLGRDASRMADASKVRFEIQPELIPRNTPDWRRAASDGEDHELLFAASGEVAHAIASSGLPITRIGSVMAGSGCFIIDGATAIDVRDLGWEHT